jgi:hypothetical protein
MLLKVLFAILGVLFILPAWADRAEEFQKMCDSSEIKRAMGSHGSCRIVVAPKPVSMQGTCTGKLLNFPCTAIFNSADKSVQFTCIQDDGTPLDLSFLGDFKSYRVAALVSGEKAMVKNDPIVYKQISGPALNINLNEQMVNGKVIVTPSMFWINDAGSLELSEVECH